MRKNTDKYVDRTMEEMAPNVRAVAGLLGARLNRQIDRQTTEPDYETSKHNSGFRRRKALFRSLKTGARPPKHGLIFQHTLLHDAKRWQREKLPVSSQANSPSPLELTPSEATSSETT